MAWHGPVDTFYNTKIGAEQDVSWPFKMGGLNIYIYPYFYKIESLKLPFLGAFSTLSPFGC